MLRMRFRTLMSLLSVGLAACVVATLAVVQLRRPEAALASSAQVSADASNVGGALAPYTFRDIARAAQGAASRGRREIPVDAGNRMQILLHLRCDSARLHAGRGVAQDRKFRRA